jgi:predicted RNA binding protein YcfA (HicA-like mRNA interferase family)
MAARRNLGATMAKKVREVIVVLERNGWVLVRRRGSHRQFRHPDVPFVVTVAGKPSTTVPPGILSNIRRTSGLEELR